MCVRVCLLLTIAINQSINQSIDQSSQSVSQSVFMCVSVICWRGDQTVSKIGNWKLFSAISLVSRNSSVGRALDWRSKGPWFNPGFRHGTFPGGWHFFLLLPTVLFLFVFQLRQDFSYSYSIPFFLSFPLSRFFFIFSFFSLLHLVVVVVAAAAATAATFVFKALRLWKSSHRRGRACQCVFVFVCC